MNECKIVLIQLLVKSHQKGVPISKLVACRVFLEKRI